MRGVVPAADAAQPLASGLIRPGPLRTLPASVVRPGRDAKPPPARGNDLRT